MLRKRLQQLQKDDSSPVSCCSILDSVVEIFPWLPRNSHNTLYLWLFTLRQLPLASLMYRVLGGLYFWLRSPHTLWKQPHQLKWLACFWPAEHIINRDARRKVPERCPMLCWGLFQKLPPAQKWFSWAFLWLVELSLPQQTPTFLCKQIKYYFLSIPSFSAQTLIFFPFSCNNSRMHS